MKIYVLALATVLFSGCYTPNTQQANNELMSDQPKERLSPKDIYPENYTFMLPSGSYSRLLRTILANGSQNIQDVQGNYFFSQSTETSQHSLVLLNPKFWENHKQELKISGYCFDKAKGPDEFTFFYYVWPNDSVTVRSTGSLSKESVHREIEEVRNLVFYE